MWQKAKDLMATFILNDWFAVTIPRKLVAMCLHHHIDNSDNTYLNSNKHLLTLAYIIILDGGNVGSSGVLNL